MPKMEASWMVVPVDILDLLSCEAVTPVTCIFIWLTDHRCQNFDDRSRLQCSTFQPPGPEWESHGIPDRADSSPRSRSLGPRALVESSWTRGLKKWNNSSNLVSYYRGLGPWTQGPGQNLRPSWFSWNHGGGGIHTHDHGESHQHGHVKMLKFHFVEGKCTSLKGYRATMEGDKLIYSTVSSLLTGGLARICTHPVSQQL